MVVRVLHGEARAVLRTLPAESVHCIVTSPPFYSLRQYGTPAMWGGEPDHPHEFGAAVRAPWANDVPGPSLNHPKNREASHWRSKQAGAFCACGAWRGELGLEPDPDLYVAHVVEVLREVWRVLRRDGVCWLNLGDSYAGSGKGPTTDKTTLANGRGAGVKRTALERQGFVNQKSYTGDGGANRHRLEAGVIGNAWVPPAPGYKQKCLYGIPWLVAFALMADGWIVRAAPPWLKANALPESVLDRPSNALETIFLLAKSPRYYWDAEAVRMASNPAQEAHNRKYARVYAAFEENAHNRQPGNVNHRGIHSRPGPGGRNRRNTDWAFESLDRLIQEQRDYLAHLERVRADGGLLLDQGGDPLAFFVNPRPMKEEHYASWPPDLVEPCIKAGTSEKGCCPACGAPWVRVVVSGERVSASHSTSRKGMEIVRQSRGATSVDTSIFATGKKISRETTGWASSCRCEAGPPIPCTALDPFGGSGTTAIVADRLGRDAILIELKDSYAEMARRRVANDAPLFVEVVS